MKWMNLKNYLSPLFSKEIDKVSQTYMSNIFIFLFSNIIDLILEISKTENKEKYKEYISLKESIQNRISQIDSFYELNFDQDYINNFEIGRIKLKKLLMYEPETISEINDLNENEKCILVGYDKIIEEKESESSHENKEYDDSFNQNKNIIINNTKISNNYKKPNNNKLFYSNNMNNIINKKGFFDDYNSKLKDSNNITIINNNNKIKSKIYSQKTTNNNTIDKNKVKNKTKYINSIKNKSPIKINDNKNNDKSTIKSIESTNRQKIDNLDDNRNIEEENINDKDNYNNTISLNSFMHKISDTDRNEIKEINKKRKIKNSNRDSLAQNNMQLKEILFRFILTKEEYEVLMKEKAKIQDILIN